jgi:cytochrome c peroxidase
MQIKSSTQKKIQPLAQIRMLALAPAVLLLAACDQPHGKKAPAASATPQVQESVVAKNAAARIDAGQAPFSAMALLGKQIFFDATLSGSGKMSCASCHDPANAYAPANALAVQMGGGDLKSQGLRAVPSLTYLEYTPPFSIGPDLKPDDNDDPQAMARLAAQLDAKLSAGVKVGSVVKAEIGKSGAAANLVEAMVPQGGMDWDGRAASLPDQAGGPLLDPREMANQSGVSLMAKLKAAPYAGQMTQLFGPGVFTTPNLALGEAYFALARYQLEERSFHPYDSKFDYTLAGRVKLSEQEAHGLKLFDDPKKGNCASCHLDKPSKDGRFAPVFTDYQFEALAAPRNTAILRNRDARFYDQGLCGPLRTDLTKQKNYCGLFKTPTLRNVATRQVFYHNGVFRTLEDAVRFYVERETRPERWYPKKANGKLDMYNDLPPAHRANVDVADAPFDRKLGAEPALNDAEIGDIVAFLKTLSDGYTK